MRRKATQLHTLSPRGGPNEEFSGEIGDRDWALLFGGCATKKYVQQSTGPIQSKLDQVGDQANKQSASIETQKDIERHETGINAAKERATSAEESK